MNTYIPRFCLLLIVISLLTAGCHHVLSKKELLRVYYDSVTHALPDVKFKIANDSTVTGAFKGLQIRLSLDNAYIDYKKEPDSIGSILSRYVASAAGIYTINTRLVPENILPIIKPVSYLADMAGIKGEPAAKNKFDAVFEPYNDQLVIVYAEDTKAGISYFLEDDLKKAGIIKDSLRRLAIKNLARILDSEIQLRGGDGLYMITAGGNYEASLLLLDYVWTKENIKVDGDFVVGVPSRDVLLIAGSNNKAAIAKMKETVKKTYAEGNYTVSDYLYRRVGDKFVKYE